MFHTVRARIIASFLVALAVVVSATVVLSYLTIHDQEHTVTDTMGLSAAESCAAVYEAFANDDDMLVPGSAGYDDCHQMLRSLCKTYGMSYLYVYRCDIASQTVAYLMCAAADDGDDEAFNGERPYGAVFHSDISDVELRALSGEDVSQAREFDNDLGHMLDWFSLVEGSDGTVLAGASYSISDQRERVVLTALHTVTPFVLGLAVLLVVELLVLNRRVFSPLRVIADRMRSFSAERADEVVPLDIDSRDEMADISGAFEGMAANIAGYTRDIERMTAERVASDVELGVARRIQLGMVPGLTDLRGAGFELAACARPAREVGGDFYDVIELDGGCVALVVGDVSGKGVAAALFMAMVKTMVRDALLAGESPAHALSHVNDRLCASNPEGMFATAFAAVFDPAAGELRYANAGHVPPLVVGEKVHALEIEPGVLLGLFEDAAPVEGSLVLERGKWLLICTDGADEAVNVEGSFLGADGLAARLYEEAPYTCARDLVDTLVRAVDAFADGREQFDDLTAVAIGRTSDDVREGALPADIDSFDALRDEILGKSTDDAAGLKVCLACEEAFANIVSHSSASGVWYQVSAFEGILAVTLEDDGVPFDPLADAPEVKPFDDLDTGGMGIALICDLSSCVSYHRENDRNVLELRFEMPD